MRTLVSLSSFYPSLSSSPCPSCLLPSPFHSFSCDLSPILCLPACSRHSVMTCSCSTTSHSPSSSSFRCTIFSEEHDGITVHGSAKALLVDTQACPFPALLSPLSSLLLPRSFFLHPLFSSPLLPSRRSTPLLFLSLSSSFPDPYPPGPPLSLPLLRLSSGLNVRQAWSKRSSWSSC